MSLLTTNSKFVAHIYLKKSIFFGNENVITIVVTPSLKIITINDKFKILPFKEGDFLKVNTLIEWVDNNKYEFTFITKNSKLKRDLYFYFDNIIIKSNKNRKPLIIKVFGWLNSLIKNKIFIKK
jgi:hypothetical protein